jgi:hypothetical protein
MTAAEQTPESVSAEIQRLVTERQELRARGAGQAELEENRRRLAGAQATFSRLLIRRHLLQAA